MKYGYKVSLMHLAGVVILLFVMISSAHAENLFSEADAQVETIIRHGEEPSGVVFKIETPDPLALKKLPPMW
ncbi:MAG: hypothetical protein ISEC1_P1397 [Thiomicrorhabdus sp.]|nr:MAG: hypothetical protein ISEC1_P1397 [Thiomicrorhabdus sp.]